MQRWEYLTVDFITDGTKKDYKVRWVNGQELPNWNKGPDFWTYLNLLGQDGWEMVGCGNVRESYHRIYFRHPLP